MVKDSALGRNDMRSLLEQSRDSVCTYLKLGYRVESPIGSFHPGTLCKMLAPRARFDKTDPEQGLFFVDIDAAESAVRVTSYSRTGSRAPGFECCLPTISS